MPQPLPRARCRVTIFPHSPGSQEENRSQGATLWVWPTNQNPVYMRGEERERQSD